MRRLIINADDFGLTSGIDRAILRSHEHGIVTSATAMANGNDVAHAASLARVSGGFGVGCHVVLIDGQPLTPAASLRGAGTAGPQKNGSPPSSSFRSSISDFAVAAVTGKFSADDIAAEAISQMRALQAFGLTLTHFDSHKHTHMFPAVLRPLLRAARECGVRAVRNPFVPIRAIKSAKLFSHHSLWLRALETRALYVFAATFNREVAAAGLRTTSGSFGVIETGVLDQQLFNNIVHAMPDGTWELVCHPGYNDAALAQVQTRLRASREVELQVLTSDESRARLRQRGIDLIHFGDL